MGIGERIRDRRRAAGLTQEAFAEALGVSVQTVSRWERGATLPDVASLADACAILGASADEILGIERRQTMAKLMRTTEVFECETRDEAVALVARFEGETFPRLVSCTIAERDGAFEVEAVKEFGAPLEGMSFGV